MHYNGDDHNEDAGDSERKEDHHIPTGAGYSVLGTAWCHSCDAVQAGLNYLAIYVLTIIAVFLAVGVLLRRILDFIQFAA